MNRITDTLYLQAMSKVPSLQTWPGHFLAKKTETEIILGNFDFQKIRGGIGLEIGCGNAFQSALIATFANKLVATDLFAQDRHSPHTVGMNKARTLIDALNSRNITLVSCSSTSLPFTDNYFDFVFSSSSLEHIENKALALREMRRVLKPGGYSVIVVPTHMPSAYAFIHIYLYCLSRIAKLFFWHKEESPAIPQDEDSNHQEISLFKRFKKNHPSFPLPEPHGSYANIFNELVSQFPAKWIKLIERNGFIVRDSFAICLMPWLLIEPFSTIAAARTYLLTKNINIRLSSVKGLKYISYLMGIISVKNS